MKNPIEYPWRFSRLLLILFLLPGAKAAAVNIPHGTVDLIAENRWIAPGHPAYLGLNFKIEKGWHIYWVNPGDSGEPPRIEWQLPAGLSAGEIEWPAPRRLVTSTIVDFGYVDAVTLLVPLRASTSLPMNRDAQISANLRVLVCREICIPGKSQFSMSIPVNAKSPEADVQNSPLFAAARQRLPQPAPANWKFNVREEKDSFVLTAKLDRKITAASFFPLEESQIDNSALQKIIPVPGGFRLTLRKSDQLLKPIPRLRGILELPQNEAYIIDGLIRVAP